MTQHIITVLEFQNSSEGEETQPRTPYTFRYKMNALYQK